MFIRLLTHAVDFKQLESGFKGVSDSLYLDVLLRVRLTPRTPTFAPHVGQFLNDFIPPWVTCRSEFPFKSLFFGWIDYKLISFQPRMGPWNIQFLWKTIPYEHPWIQKWKITWKQPWVPIIAGAKSPSRNGLRAIYDFLFSIFKSVSENLWA